MFFKRKSKRDPDTDPIIITHAQDDSLDEDEMIIYSTVETHNHFSAKTHWPFNSPPLKSSKKETK